MTSLSERLRARVAGFKTVLGAPIRVHDMYGDDLGIAHLPTPVELGDVLELGHGPILLLRVVDVVETGPYSPLAALGKVSPVPMVVR